MAADWHQLLGVGAACTFTVGLLASIHADRDGLAAVWLLFGPPLLFVVPAATAAAVDHSFRGGVRAGTWTAITVMPLTFALLLVEASRQYADDGEWLFAGDVTTAGFSIGLALADPHRHSRDRIPVRRPRGHRRSAASCHARTEVPTTRAEVSASCGTWPPAATSAVDQVQDRSAGVAGHLVQVDSVRTNDVEVGNVADELPSVA